MNFKMKDCFLLVVCFLLGCDRASASYIIYTESVTEAACKSVPDTTIGYTATGNCQLVKSYSGVDSSQKVVLTTSGSTVTLTKTLYTDTACNTPKGQPLTETRTLNTCVNLPSSEIGASAVWTKALSTGAGNVPEYSSSSSTVVRQDYGTSDTTCATVLSWDTVKTCASNSAFSSLLTTCSSAEDTTFMMSSYSSLDCTGPTTNSGNSGNKPMNQCKSNPSMDYVSEEGRYKYVCKTSAPPAPVPPTPSPGTASYIIYTESSTEAACKNTPDVTIGYTATGTCTLLETNSATGSTKVVISTSGTTVTVTSNMYSDPSCVTSSGTSQHIFTLGTCVSETAGATTLWTKVLFTGQGNVPSYTATSPTVVLQSFGTSDPNCVTPITWETNARCSPRAGGSVSAICNSAGDKTFTESSYSTANCAGAAIAASTYTTDLNKCTADIV